MKTDLSKIHHYVGKTFPDINDVDVSSLKLSHEQLEFFQDNGYVSGIRLLNGTQIEQLRQELENLMAPNHDGQELWYEYNANESSVPGTVLFHALGAWRIEPGFHDALWNPAFTIPASQLLDGPVRFWHDQLFCKPPLHGGVVAWHQDYSYWTRTKPMSHLTCWIALDEATKENGCLHYIPGSHKWNLLPVTGLAGDMDSIKDVLTEPQWEQFCEPATIELQPGECSFHHPLMVHGSYENRTERPRRGFVINAIRDGVMSDSGDELLKGVPPIPAGQKMDGQFFPFLYQPDT